MNKIWQCIKQRNFRSRVGCDFSNYFEKTEETRKQRLLQECKRRNVSPYIDNPSEQSTGFYSCFRGIASEAELEKRLNMKKAMEQTKLVNLSAAVTISIQAAAIFLN